MSNIALILRCITSRWSRRRGPDAGAPRLSANVRPPRSNINGETVNKDGPKRAWLLDRLKQEDERTLTERVERRMQVPHSGILPNTRFAPVWTECLNLFGDGHYFGAISLSQSVVEALVRHLCRAHSWRPAENFERNVKKLRERGFIDERIERHLLQIWEHRDDFHHLNDSVEGQRSALQALALAKLQALSELESWAFGHTFDAGRIVLKKAKYWSTRRTGDGVKPERAV